MTAAELMKGIFEHVSMFPVLLCFETINNTYTKCPKQKCFFPVTMTISEKTLMSWITFCYPLPGKVGWVALFIESTNHYSSSDSSVIVL